MTARFVRATALILVVYVGLISLTGFQLARMPSGFIPDQELATSSPSSSYRRVQV
jgi:hypothetical protein